MRAFARRGLADLGGLRMSAPAAQSEPLRLYGFWRSLATFRVRIALNIKQIAHQEIMIDLIAGDQNEQDFRLINPMQAVPALFDNEQSALTQSIAIMEYLDETRPQPPLLPTDARGRAQVRALALIAAADSHPLVTPRVRTYLGETLKVSAEQQTEWCRHWMATGLEAVEHHLSHAQSSGLYCHGDSVTMADICVVSSAVGLRFFGGDLDETPRVARIVAACLEQDAFAKAHPLRQPGAPAS